MTDDVLKKILKMQHIWPYEGPPLPIHLFEFWHICKKTQTKM